MSFFGGGYFARNVVRELRSEELISRRELARRLGVDDKAIRVAIQQGRIKASAMRGSKLLADTAAGQFLATRTLNNNNRSGELKAEQEASGKLDLGLPEDDVPEFLEDEKSDSEGSWAAVHNEERAKLVREQRLKAQMERLELQGKLHRAEDVEAVWESILLRCRQRLLAIPSNLAGKLRNKGNPAEIRAILEDSILEALEQLSVYDAGEFASVRNRRKRGERKPN